MWGFNIPNEISWHDFGGILSYFYKVTINNGVVSLWTWRGGINRRKRGSKLKYPSQVWVFQNYTTFELLGYIWAILKTV